MTDQHWTQSILYADQEKLDEAEKMASRHCKGYEEI
jgi:hypothetical protein